MTTSEVTMLNRIPGPLPVPEDQLGTEIMWTTGTFPPTMFFGYLLGLFYAVQGLFWSRQVRIS